MGLLISCYESCWGDRIANGESINPYTLPHRRRSQFDAQQEDTERKTQDEMCGLLSSKSINHVYTTQPSSSSALGRVINKPQKGMKFYPFMHSSSTNKFVK